MTEADEIQQRAIHKRCAENSGIFNPPSVSPYPFMSTFAKPSLLPCPLHKR